MYDPVLYFLQACFTIILLVYIATSFFRGATKFEALEGTQVVLIVAGLITSIALVIAAFNPEFHYTTATLLIGRHSLEVSPDILPGLQVGVDFLGVILGLVVWCGTNPEAMNVRRGYY